MKKNNLIVAVCILTLATISCTNDDEIVNDSSQAGDVRISARSTISSATDKKTNNRLRVENSVSNARN